MEREGYGDEPRVLCVEGRLVRDQQRFPGPSACRCPFGTTYEEARKLELDSNDICTTPH